MRFTISLFRNKYFVFTDSSTPLARPVLNFRLFILIIFFRRIKNGTRSVLNFRLFILIIFFRRIKNGTRS